MFYKKFLLKALCFGAFLIAPCVAHASVVDALNLAPFVPMVLDALMMTATGIYEYFVGDGNHTGFIYIMVWTFLGATLTISLVKMYFPKKWLAFLGMSGGGEIVEGNVSGFKLIENTLKPCVRAAIASLVLLQLKPVYLTQWLVNPFLQLGAIYTHQITESINDVNAQSEPIECPQEILAKKWISKESCEFLIQPVYDLSNANNQMVKRGFDFLFEGMRGLMVLIPHGGEGFLNLVTGLILISTFVASNLFMALLVIQGIFNFGIQLILYPFYVLTYVFKPNDKLFDIWPAFSGITKALQQLIITMIACAFILCINIAVIKALFNWNSSVFVVAAGGSAYSNVPTMAQPVMGFGGHSVLWLSAIMTFYLMFKIFDITQNQLNQYIGGGMDGLYKDVRNDTKTLFKDVKNLGKTIGKAAGWLKK